MKKPLLFLMLLLASMAKAQSFEFAPIGAEWYYETQGMFSRGYIKMVAEKDTVIDGYDCIKLAREEHWHNLEFGGLFSAPLPPLFLSQVGDTVTLYWNGAFYKLFDFGAEIGDTWNVAGSPGVCPEDYGTVVVVDKGVDTINGIPLRFVTTKDLPDSYWGFGGSMHGTLSGAVKIVERIGPMGYMLPEQRCEFDNTEGGPLRCYIDDEVGELHFSTYFPDRYCDYISDTYQSVDNLEANDRVSVFPNPCTEKLHLFFNEVSIHQITVFDNTGRTVQGCNVKGKEAELNLGALTPGLYCVTVCDGTKTLTIKIFKQ